MGIGDEIARGHRRGRLTVADLSAITLVGSLSSDALTEVTAAAHWQVYRLHEAVGGWEDRGQSLFIVAAGTVRWYIIVDKDEFASPAAGPGDLLDPVLPPDDLAMTTELRATSDETLVYTLPRAPFRPGRPHRPLT